MRRALAVVLVVAGAAAPADAVLTAAWQEPVSALRVRYAQPRLRAELQALGRDGDAPSCRRWVAMATAMATQRRAAVAASAGHRTTYGAPFRHIDRSSCPPVIRCSPPLVASSSTLPRSA